MERKRKGFTLTELVVVVVIVGLLLAVLIPTLTSFIRKSRESKDIQTARNMTIVVNASGYEISNMVELKEVIAEEFGLEFWSDLKPETSDRGNHFWFNYKDKKVELKTYEEIKERSDYQLFDSSFRSSLKKGYVLLDQTGSELVEMANLFDHVCTRDECDQILAYFESESEIAANFIEGLEDTIIINTNGCLRGSDVDSITKVYFSNDYVALNKALFFEFKDGSITFRKIDQEHPLLGNGMDGKSIDIKSSMFFGTNTLLVKEGVHVTLNVDVTDVMELKKIFAARSTNANIRIKGDSRIFKIVDDNIIEVGTDNIVVAELEYTIAQAVLNYSMPQAEDVSASQSVSTNADNQVTEETNIETGTEVTATIPAGVSVDSDNLELSVSNMEVSESNLVLNNYVTSSLNVHIEGIAADNEVPIIVNLGPVMPSGLSYNVVRLFHIENKESIEMNRVDSLAELDLHNEYYYDFETGNVTLALKSFSEILIGINTSTKWDGSVDTKWYTDAIKANSNATEFHISTAEELAGLSAIVNGEEPDGIERDKFLGKKIYLDNDIILNDWYVPTDKGYTYDGEHTAIGMSTSSTNDAAFEQYTDDNSRHFKVLTPIGKDCDHYFCGSFDGQNHTISGLYGIETEVWGRRGRYLGLFGVLAGPDAEDKANDEYPYKLPTVVENLTISNSWYYYYGAYIGLVASLTYGDVTYDNIRITGNYVSQYNRNSGGITAYVYAGSNVILNNIVVDDTNIIEALWGTYDGIYGGLIGEIAASSENPSNIHFSNCQVFPVMNVYNDVQANNQYHQFRYSGMLVGWLGEDREYAQEFVRDHIEFENVLVHYEEWQIQYYCELKSLGKGSYCGPHDWKWTRIDSSYAKNEEFEEGKTCTVPSHNHAANAEDEDNIAVKIIFDQLAGVGYYYHEGFEPVTAYSLSEIKTGMPNQYCGVSQDTSIITLRIDGKDYRYIARNYTEFVFPDVNKIGYNVLGWSTTDDSTVDYDNDENKLTVRDDILLFAVTSAHTYNISYTDGGSVSSPTSATYGTEFTVANPTKTGYEFDGWTAGGTDYNSDTAKYGSSEADTAWGNGSTLVTDTKFKNLASKDDGNITLTGNWTPYTFGSISIASGKGSANGVVKWYTDSEMTKEVSGSNKIAYDSTIYYKILANTGYALPGTSSGSMSLVSGSNFLLSGTGESATMTMISSLPACTAISYDLTYDLDGGSVASANPTTYNVATATFTLNNPTKTGYTFKGWSGTGLTGDSNTSVSVAVGSTGARSYTANWTPISYSIIFNANGGTGTMSNQIFDYDSAQNLSTNAFTRSGYRLIGWNTKQYATDKLYDDKESVNNLSATNNDTITLYAIWETTIYVTNNRNWSEMYAFAFKNDMNISDVVDYNPNYIYVTYDSETAPYIYCCVPGSSGEEDAHQLTKHSSYGNLFYYDMSDATAYTHFILKTTSGKGESDWANKTADTLISSYIGKVVSYSKVWTAGNALGSASTTADIATSVWPGLRLSFVDMNEEGHARLSEALNGLYDTIIFNDHSSSQTVDITVNQASGDGYWISSTTDGSGHYNLGGQYSYSQNTDETLIYYDNSTTNWNGVKTHAWFNTADTNRIYVQYTLVGSPRIYAWNDSGNNGSSGVAMTLVPGQSNIYYWDCGSYTKFILLHASGHYKDVSNDHKVGGYTKITGDCNISDYKNKLYSIPSFKSEGWASDSSTVATSDILMDTWPGPSMTPCTDSSLYCISINTIYTKIIFSDAENSNYKTEDLAIDREYRKYNGEWVSIY